MRRRRINPLRCVALWLALMLLPMIVRADDQKLLAALSDPSFKVRLQAAILVGKKGITTATPALQKLLSDEQDTVRAAAAISLGKLGAQTARADLVRILADPNDLPAQAAEKALALLDKAGGGPRFLLVIDPVLLPADTPRAIGGSLQRLLTRDLARNPSVLLSSGEEKIVAGPRLDSHLRARQLSGIRLQPKVLTWRVSSSASGTNFACKISIMVVTLTSGRMEFAGNGQADADTEDSDLSPEDREDIERQILEAALQAAGRQVLGYLARRDLP